jgi:transcription elongation factor GreA
MANYTYLTQAGYDKLKKDLEELKSNGRQEAAAAIAEARDKGDLSENAEYDAAKEAQGHLEARIAKMEDLAANARLIDDSHIDNSKVFILSRVKLRNLKTSTEVEYILVAENEANLAEKKISIDSPIGKGLLGKKVGDIADVQVPAGTLQLEILDINR